MIGQNGVSPKCFMFEKECLMGQNWGAAGLYSWHLFSTWSAHALYIELIKSLVVYLQWGIHDEMH